MTERTPIDPTLRYTYITDTERALIEKGSHDFYTLTGQPMRVPPSLHLQLRIGGVDMKRIIADPSLEQ